LTTPTDALCGLFARATIEALNKSQTQPEANTVVSGEQQLSIIKWWL